jgi:hypothetical protein
MIQGMMQKTRITARMMSKTTSPFDFFLGAGIEVIGGGGVMEAPTGGVAGCDGGA